MIDALRSAWRFAATTNSVRHDDLFIESHLDLRDLSGAVVPGYGWIFPLGDGRVNVGVGLLTVSGRWKGLNTSHLMDAFVESAPRSWGLSPETSCGPPTGGKLPMGFAIHPMTGPNAHSGRRRSGLHQPVQRRRHRIRVRDRTARSFVFEQGAVRRRRCGRRRLRTSTPRLLWRLLQGRQGLREADQQPSGAPRLHPHGMAVPPIMAGLLRIMANLMRPDAHAPPEMAYQALCGRRQVGARLLTDTLERLRLLLFGEARWRGSLEKLLKSAALRSAELSTSNSVSFRPGCLRPDCLRPGRLRRVCI